ncbi:MAG TPA: transcription antitermination factor NusB [Rickettsiales bacterium]|nr:transcription antitermination factor NusB [Rickettsiales bacterium]
MEENKIINKKSFSRFFATQILFSYFFDTKENEDLDSLKAFLEEYYISNEFSEKNSEEYKENINMNFLNKLIYGVVEHIDVIDSILSENLDTKYNLNIIDKLIKIILRLAMFEFKYTDTDRKIIINEYVDIAGEYFDKKAISFVNAILDKLSKI